MSTAPSAAPGQAAASSLPRAGGVFLRIERLTTGLGTVLASGALAAAALIGLFQIVTRFVLAQPAPWSEPVVRTLLIWMVYLGLCGAARTGSLVAVDVIYALAPPPLRRAMRLFILLACVLFFAILGWFGIQMVEFVQHQKLAGVGISIAWGYAAIPAGSILAILALLAHYLDPGPLFESDADALSEQAL